MTPAQHLAEADRLLEMVGREDSPWSADWVLARAMQAQAHALAAIAVELGAPHDAGPKVVTTNG